MKTITLKEALDLLNKELQDNLNVSDYKDRKEIKIADINLKDMYTSHWGCDERNTLTVKSNSRCAIKVKSKKLKVPGRYSWGEDKMVITEVYLHPNTDEMYLDMTGDEIEKEAFVRRQKAEQRTADRQQEKLDEFKELLQSSGIDAKTFKELNQKFNSLTYSHQCEIK